MTPPLAMLDLPIPETACRVARAQLARWNVEARRLARGTDPEALHDYRTAIRRLRSLLRMFHPWLPDLPGNARRRLRRLMRLTGPSRNLDVLIAWTERHRADLTPRQRAGARWLARRLDARLDHHNQNMRSRLTDRESKLRARIERGLARPASRGSIGSGTPPAQLVVRRLLRRETGVLTARLDPIGSLAGATAIHEARIAAKRLRYLLEPFAAELDYADDLLERLRTLQDLLGTVTDAHVMARELREALLIANAGRAERLGQELLEDLGAPPAGPMAAPPPRGAQSGLATLAGALRREGEEAFARLKGWLGEPRQELLETLRLAGEVNRGGRI